MRRRIMNQGLEAMDNPWLKIPAADYEAHMGSPNVDQLTFLGRIFKEALRKQDCSAVAVLGCATGNGLEYINRDTTIKVTVVDINPEYLQILRQRFKTSLPGLDIMEGDLETCELEKQTYSMIFAGLIFEYLDPRKVLPGIASWLKQKGAMVAVLQLHANDEKKVTDTSYVSLKKLEKVMKLISPQVFKVMANEAGLVEKESKTATLESGKSFYIATYKNQRTGV